MKFFRICVFLLFCFEASGQTVQVFRSFNPTADSCTDSPSTIIVETNPSFGSGKWYQCQSGSYVFSDLNTIDRFTVGETPAQVSLSATGSGNVDVGNHSYSMTCVTATGESAGSTNADITISASAKPVTVTLPLCSSSATSRKLYRTKAASGFYPNPLGFETDIYYLVTTIADNFTTVVIDNTADSGLSTQGRLLANNYTTGRFFVGTTNAGFLGASNTFLGFNTSGPTVGSYNSIIGARGAINIVGDFNSCVGYECLLGLNSSGALNSNFNSAFGFQGLKSTTTGYQNSTLGAVAGFSNTTGFNKILIGYQAGHFTQTDSDNICIGVNACAGSSSSTGTGNNAIGSGAFFAFTTATGDNLHGLSAGAAITQGGFDAFFGHQAGLNTTTGANNSFFGGHNVGNTNTTGSNNTLVGDLADVNANNLDHAACFGAGCVADASNQIVLGRSTDGVKIPGNTVFPVTSSGNNVRSSEGNQRAFFASNSFTGFQGGNTDGTTGSAFIFNNGAGTGLITVTNAGNVTQAFGTFQAPNINITGSETNQAPITKTADFTVATTDLWLINNKSGSTCVVTLPTASSFTGRVLHIKTIQAQLVNSASSNVVPLVGGAAATAILAATAGKWATLISDGTNWIIVEGN